MGFVIDLNWICVIAIRMYPLNGFFWGGFTPCKAEQPLQGMELEETQKRLQDIESLFRKNLQLKDFC